VYSRHGPCSHHMSATTVQTCVQCNIEIFNAMRTLLDLTRIYLYQSFIKTAINTAITVKLLTSKVTLNTYEKLKMPHEKQLDLGNIKSKVNETCYCETCLSQLG
jgi:Ni,Fe-hydrogenase III small subunit